MWKLYLILFTLAFALGQFARIKLAPGVNLLGIDAIAIVFGGYFVLEQTLRKKKIKSELSRPIAIFSFVALLSLLANLYWVGFENAMVAGMYLVRFLAYFGMYLFIRRRSKADLAVLRKVLLFIVTFTVIVGFFQVVYYPNLRNLYYLGWDDHLYRLFSVFLDPNYTGVMFVLFLVYLAYYFFTLKSKQLLAKVLLLVIALGTFLSVFLTYSRTALVTLVFGGVFYLGLMKKRALVLLFSLIVFIFFLSTINPDIEGLNPFRTVSTNARFNSYEIALNIFADNPVLGVGFNTYRYAQNMYGYRTGGAWETSHADAGTDNSFLLVLATTGVLGLGAFVYLWYKVIRLLRIKIEEGSSIARSALISVISVFIASFFVNALFYPFILAWLWVLIALSDRKIKA